MSESETERRLAEEQRISEGLEKALRRAEDRAYESTASTLRAMGGSTVRQVGPRKPGRPPRSGMLLPSRESILSPFTAYWQSIGRRPTKQEFCKYLGVSADTLDNALKSHGLPWPPDGAP